MVFDDNSSLSEGYSTDEEEGEDYYAYLGEPLVLPSDIEALTRDVVSGHKDGDDCDDASDDSLPEFDPSDGSYEEDTLGLTGTRSDDYDASKSDFHEPSENDDDDDNFPGTARVDRHYHTLVRYWT